MTTSKINPSRFKLSKESWNRMGRLKGNVLIPVLSLALQCTTAFGAETSSPSSPSFSVKGKVSEDEYTQNSTNSKAHKEGSFLFAYTNGAWQVQIGDQKSNVRGVDPGKFSHTIINCKNIEGGMRYFITSTLAPKRPSVPQAVVQSIAFPPPEESELLICWLALCPDPELPTMPGGRIRRLLPLKYYDNTNNFGTYATAYLEPEGIFLNQFQLTNNGILFYGDNEMLRMHPPLDQGNCELAYEVTQTTNFNGGLFPERAVLTYFALKDNAGHLDDIYAAQITHLNVDEISLSTEARFVKPPKLWALDFRPTNLPTGQSVKYTISDDRWLSPTNSFVAERAKGLGGHGAATSKKHHERMRVMAVAVIVTLLVLPPIGYGIYRERNSDKNNEQK